MDLTLTISLSVSAADLVGRVLGPDRHGVRYIVTRSWLDDDGSRRYALRPLAAHQSSLTRDGWGQWWLHEPPEPGTVRHLHPVPDTEEIQP